MHRIMKRLLCRNTLSIFRRTLHYDRPYSRKPTFSSVPRTYYFSTPGFCIATSALFDGPRQNHLQGSPKQSSSSLLAIIFGVCVSAGLIYEIFNTEELDLRGISPIPYTPLLAPDAFRTLVLLPGSGSQPIRCELMSAKLSEHPPYEALSYRWGDPKQLKAIFVNGVKVQITENLWLALSSLRHSQYSRSLWADAICINQQDNSEKALQVPNMAAIYQCARSVIIYVGNHQPYNDLHQRSSFNVVELAITNVLEPYTHTKQPLEPALDAHGILIETSQSSTKQSIENKVNEAMRNARVAQVGMEYFLRNIIHEEYWKRGWIVQEVVMASENLVVCFGSNLVVWEEFMHWVLGYHQRHPDDDSVQHIVRLDELRQLRSRSGSIFTLTSLLDAFKDSFTSPSSNGVFHDKVYAFLGLAHDCPSGSFPVSYKKSAAQVYQDCVTYFWQNSSLTPKQRSIELVYFSSLIRRLLTREPALRRKSGRPFGEHPYEAEFLLSSQYQKQHSVTVNIIAWIIHFLVMSIRMAIFERHRTGQESFWKASKAEDLASWVSNREKSEIIHDLCIRGIVVDEIQHIGPPYTAVMSANNKLNDWSLVAANPPVGNADLASQTKLLSKVKSLLHSIGPSTTHYVAYLLCPTQELSDWRSNVDTEVIVYTQEKKIPRIFFSAGRSAGLVPPQAQAGDLICRFWNSNTYAVVRMEQHKQSLVSLVRDFFQREDSRKNFRLIGRAIMADADFSEKDISSRLNGELFGIVNEKAIDVPVNLATLTHLTLNTTFWDET